MAGLPEGYYIDESGSWGPWLKRKDGKEAFRLTDRPFSDEIDHYFAYLPSQIIKYLIESSQGEVVSILDVGCGGLARAAGEIALNYPEQVEAIAVDIIPPYTRFPKNLSYLQESGENMVHVDSESIDFAYCYELLTHVESEQKQLAIAREIARALKPGKTALIRDTYFSEMAPFDPRRMQFRQETGVFVWPRQGNRFQKGEYGAGQPWVSTMLLKEPVNFDYFNIHEILQPNI